MMSKKLRFLMPRTFYVDLLLQVLTEVGFEVTDDKPDIMLTDMALVRAGEVTPLMPEAPEAKLVVIGDGLDPDLGLLFALGAAAYVRNTVSLDTLVRILEVVLAGNAVWPAEVMEGLRRQPFRPEAMTTLPIELPCDRPGPLLSPREETILRGLIEGLPNKVIARKSNIAEATVKVHVKALLRKLRVANRTQAAMWAMNNGYGANHEGRCTDRDASRRYDEGAPEPGQYPPLPALQSAGGDLPERAAGVAA